MKKIIILSFMLLCTVAEAKQWFADHHRRQTADEFIARMTQHAQMRTRQQAV